MGKPVGEPLRGHTHLVSSASFSPDGTRIVTGSRDKNVRLWDVVTGKTVGEPLRGHTDSVNSVSFSPDGTRIVTGSSDNTIRLWDTVMRQPPPQRTESDHSAFSTPFFLDRDSGWIVGPRHRLLFWVPPASRHPFYSPGTVLVIPRGGPELDLSRMAHGQHWQKCREE
ncbi:WD40-repeat-containing domain protein [Suillus americanus]|nr:WD40-repeat-containing domain protein [Suillus americanus]